MAGSPNGRITEPEGASRDRLSIGLRRASWADLLGVLLGVGSIFVAWQVSAGTYPGGRFSYTYYLYGTQCAAFNATTTCTAATDLAAPLRFSEVLMIAAVLFGVVAWAAARAAGRGGPRGESATAPSIGAAMAAGIGALSAPLLYAEYSYSQGLGLWTAPSAAGVGWYLAVLAAAALWLAAAVAGRARHRYLPSEGAPPRR